MRSLRLLTALLLCCLACMPALADKPKGDLPEHARWVAERRGDLVERVGGGIEGTDVAAIADAMKIPEDDSYKFHVSVITQRNCVPCEKLKQAFASAPELKAWVNVSDHTQSWAHYNVYRIEDASSTQWLFKGESFSRFPTILVQTPLDGRYGKRGKIVAKIEGYDGNAKALAKRLQSEVKSYVVNYKRPENAVAKGGAEASDYGPPPMDLPDNDGGNSGPLDEPARTPEVEAAEWIVWAVAGVLSLLGYLLSGVFGGSFIQAGLIALAVYVLMELRKYRTEHNQKLLLDADTYANLLQELKSHLSLGGIQSATSSSALPASSPAGSS